MPELKRFDHRSGGENASVRVGELAGRQWGVVSRRQLLDCGVSERARERWLDAGRLYRVHPGVYAVGHPAIPLEGRLVAALLHAGPGAALSHASALGWWRLNSDEQLIVHVSTLVRANSTRGVRVHHPRRLDAVLHRGLRVTTVARTLLDAASQLPFPRLRRVVAEAEYLRLLDPASIGAQLGRGRRGSSSLRRALALHNPLLAQTLSALEERFLALCEDHSLPLPEVNATVAGLMVDALWRAPGLVVELDGARSHASAAAMHRDRERDLALRAAGFDVLRYTWHQVTERPSAVAADLRRALAMI